MLATMKTKAATTAVDIEDFYRNIRRRNGPRYKEFDETATELSFNIVHTFNRLEAHLQRAIRRRGMSLAGFNVLSILNQCEASGVPLNQLSDYLLVSRANITGLIDSLAARGFVKRSNDPQDRRVRRAAITASGKAWLEKYFPEHFGTVRKLTDALRLSEKKELVDLLTKLRRGMPVI